MGERERSRDVGPDVNGVGGLLNRLLGPCGRFVEVGGPRLNVPLFEREFFAQPVFLEMFFRVVGEKHSSEDGGFYVSGWKLGVALIPDERCKGDFPDAKSRRLSQGNPAHRFQQIQR